MKWNRLPITVSLLLLLFIACNPAGIATIPENIDKFLNDYYNVVGKPELNATLQQIEFDQGEHAVLYVTLMNTGKLEKFEVNKEANASRQSEVVASQKEQQLEYEATTATGIVLTLSKVNENDPFKLKTNTAFAGALRSGLAAQPIPFKIEIDDNAPLGDYDLLLNITYDFQRDIAVEKNDENPNAPNIYYWYDQASRNFTLKFRIVKEDEAEFQVTAVEPAGFKVDSTDNIVGVTLKNTGKKSAKDLVATLRPAPDIYVDSAESPIAELKPGEAKKLLYKIDVDKDALPSKTYQMKLELKYTDPYDNEIRDHAYFYIETKEKGAAQIPGMGIASAVIAIAFSIYLYRR